jgi:hypothetical protein
MDDLWLPEELGTFLKLGRQLEYDYHAAEPGRIALVDHHSLQLNNAWVTSKGKEHAARDPNRGRRGRYQIPRVDLVSKCDRYFPEGILVWIPTRGEFGTWDYDHGDIWIFPDVCWSEIASDPLPYLNAQWYPDSVEVEWLVPWPGYPFVEQP